MSEAQLPDPAAFPDRSNRLTIFGVLAVMAGFGLMLFALLYVALPFTTLTDEMSVPWQSVVMGAATYSLLGVIFVWAGVGSIRKRRWVRSVMLVLAWSWFLAGTMMLAFSAFLLDDVLTAATSVGPPVAPEILSMAKIIVMVGLGFGGVLLPGLFVLAYRDRALLRTCERANPERGFTDDCPVPVLGLSLGLAGAGLFSLPLAFNPVVPLFGLIVGGVPGALLTLALAVACAVLALWTFRLEIRGWWGSTILMVAIGASTAVTFAVADPDRLFEALAQSGGRELGLSGSGPVMFWATIVFTVLSVGYMIGIRRHFPFERR